MQKNTEVFQHFSMLEAGCEQCKKKHVGLASMLKMVTKTSDGGWPPKKRSPRERGRVMSHGRGRGCVKDVSAFGIKKNSLLAILSSEGSEKRQILVCSLSEEACDRHRQED